MAGTISVSAKTGARPAPLEDVVPAEDVDRPSVVGPAVSDVETAAKNAAGAGEPSPDESAGLAPAKPATTGDVPPPSEAADAPPTGAVPSIAPAAGCEAWLPGWGKAAAA